MNIAKTYEPIVTNQFPQKKYKKLVLESKKLRNLYTEEDDGLEDNKFEVRSKSSKPKSPSKIIKADKSRKSKLDNENSLPNIRRVTTDEIMEENEERFDETNDGPSTNHKINDMMAVRKGNTVKPKKK